MGTPDIISTLAERILSPGARALQEAGRSLRRADLGHEERSHLLLHAASLAGRTGDTARALVHVRQAVLGFRDSTTLSLAIDTLLELGHPNEAEALLRELTARGTGNGAPSEQHRVDLLRARVELAFGRWDTALARAEALLSGEGLPSSSRPVAALVAGRAALNLRARSHARSSLMTAVREAAHLRHIRPRLEATTLLGRLLLASGEISPALEVVSATLASLDATPIDELPRPDGTERTALTGLALDLLAETSRRDESRREASPLARRIVGTARLLSARRRLLGEETSLLELVPEELLLSVERVDGEVTALLLDWHRDEVSHRSGSLLDRSLVKAEKRLVALRGHCARTCPFLAVMLGVPLEGAVVRVPLSDPLVLTVVPGPERSALIILAEGSLVHAGTLPRADLFASWIDHRLASPAVLDPTVERESSGALLGRALLAPIEAELRPGRPILVHASGPSARLHLESLPHPGASHPATLGELHPVVLLGGATRGEASPPSRLPHQGSLSVLVIADPKFSDESFSPDSTAPGLRARDLDFGLRPLLTQGALEWDEISRIVPGARLLTGEEATFDRLAALAPLHDVLHISTCPIDDPADSTRIGLALASLGDPLEEGALRRQKILRLELAGTVVVLSPSIEGQRSTPSDVRRWSRVLAEALLLGGASAVIAPFRVRPAMETRAFLAALYREMVSGADPASALRSARTTCGAAAPPFSVFA